MPKRENIYAKVSKSPPVRMQDYSEAAACSVQLLEEQLVKFPGHAVKAHRGALSYRSPWELTVRNDLSEFPEYSQQLSKGAAFPTQGMPGLPLKRHPRQQINRKSRGQLQFQPPSTGSHPGIVTKSSLLLLLHELLQPQVPLIINRSARADQPSTAPSSTAFPSRHEPRLSSASACLGPISSRYANTPGLLQSLYAALPFARTNRFRVC